MDPLKQYAALPYLTGPYGLSVLLVSTRSSGRWVIPKGWPKRRLSPAELAQREAFEEAGLGGKIFAEPIGSYDYTKRMHLLAWARCRVDVFPLKVSHQFLHWPEQGGRRQTWVSPEAAADMVRERGLALIFLSLSERLGRLGSVRPDGPLT